MNFKNFIKNPLAQIPFVSSKFSTRKVDSRNNIKYFFKITLPIFINKSLDWLTNRKKSTMKTYYAEFVMNNHPNGSHKYNMTTQTDLLSFNDESDAKMWFRNEFKPLVGQWNLKGTLYLFEWYQNQKPIKIDWDVF